MSKPAATRMYINITNIKIVFPIPEFAPSLRISFAMLYEWDLNAGSQACKWSSMPAGVFILVNMKRLQMGNVETG